MLEKGLIIDEPWISMILRGSKTWEMRKTITKIRGPIALIRKGSKQVVGTADLVDSLPPLSLAEFNKQERRHGIPKDRQARAASDGWQCPWVLKNAQPLRKPVAYPHPSGAVIWVNLEPSVVKAIQAQLS